MTTTATYTTTLRLGQYLGIFNYAPSVDNATKGVGTAFERIGTATGPDIIYFLDNKAIIDGTLQIWSGGTTAASIQVTDDTHYTKDLDRGFIKLTTAGSALVGGSALYAEYQYFSPESGVNNSIALDSIRRAQNHIEQETETRFVDANTATPAFGISWQELLRGRGQHDRTYLTKYFPIHIAEARLNGSLTSTATTVAVIDTNGFPSTGTAVIGTEQFSYTGKSSTAFTGATRGVNGSTAVAHSAGLIVTDLIVEMSVTEAGSTAAWETQEYLVDFGVNKNAGSIKLVNFDSIQSSILENKFPLQDLPDRVRLTYSYGWNTIPEEIERLTLMLATKELRSSAVNRSLVLGRDEFKPSMLNVDDDWIQKTLDKYTSWKSSRPT